MNNSRWRKHGRGNLHRFLRPEHLGVRIFSTAYAAKLIGAAPPDADRTLLSPDHCSGTDGQNDWARSGRWESAYPLRLFSHAN
jgi:hypothetical protein